MGSLFFPYSLTVQCTVLVNVSEIAILKDNVILNITRFDVGRHFNKYSVFVQFPIVVYADSGKYQCFAKICNLYQTPIILWSDELNVEIKQMGKLIV
ncbi:hypothetical protein A3Q56_02856 [Intoshia linei]|uniref:Uncharacterized protein n=1 Tax=Intoshia linei TaxID=1819745 RepID=A0A177B532_9BILA|nr:hypothetical protein A3Q56_02856 [Intoshia linei]